MTEAGAIRYFLQDFDTPSLSFDGSFPKHPRLLVSAEELERAKTRFNSGEAPYREIREALLKAADNAMTAPLKGPVDSPNSIVVASHVVLDGAMANDLALAYQLTGEAPYAQRAFEIIDTWIFAEPLAGSTWQFEVRGCPGMDYARHFIYLASAWDLLANHPDATEQRATAVERLFRYHASLMKNDNNHWAENDYLGRQYFQNHMVANTFGVLWIGNLLGDRDLVQYALDHPENPRDWVALINGMIYVEGEPGLELVLGLEAPAPKTGEIVDRYRHHEAPGKGAVYALLSLGLMTISAEIANHIGIDLYASEGKYGENLGAALDYYGAMLAARDLGLHSDYLASETFLASPNTYWSVPFIAAAEHYPDNKGIQSLIESIDPGSVPNHIHYPLPWSVLIDLEN